MKQKNNSFSRQMGLWLSAVVFLLSAFSPSSSVLSTKSNDVLPLATNDAFASAEVITSLPYTSSGIDTTSYTAVDPQDKNLVACGRTAGDHSAWYQYTPVANERVTLDTLGSNVGGDITLFDTMIGVFLDSAGVLSEVSCDDDSGDTHNKSLTTVGLTAGKTYYFLVSSYNGDDLGATSNALKSNVGDLSGFNDPGGNLVFNVVSNGALVGTPPSVLSSVRANPSPTTLASVNFTVTFSEAVTGVDVNDFSLTTKGALGSAVSAVSGTGSVYTVTVNTGSSNGFIRLNVANNGTIINSSSYPLDASFINGETYRVKKTSIFVDVPFTYWANDYIERLYYAGTTGGCSTVPLNYCPENTVTRAQMAIFLLKAKYGSSYLPPAVGSGSGFGDVPLGSFAEAWIKQLAVEGITSGCGNGNYCPDATVTRASMAIFLLKAKYGPAFSPSPAIGVFADVPVGAFADKWIEKLASEGITGGCSSVPLNYCPDSSVNRAQMAIFLVKAFSMP